VIRSCLRGNAQLPESSGIHAKQFWILDFGFWIDKKTDQSLPYSLLLPNLKSKIQNLKLIDQAVWSPANNILLSTGICLM